MPPSARFLYEVKNLRLRLDEPEEALRQLVTKVLGCSMDEPIGVECLRRSVDARGHRPPVLVVDALVELSSPLKGLPASTAPYAPPNLPPLPSPPVGLDRETIAIVGTGPCGLFAALVLACRGVPTVLFERGEPVEGRTKSIGRLLSSSVLNEESNYCFGEGGGGTFSDGKLFTRIRDPEATRVFDLLVEHGAPPEIRIDRHPHLGTDRLIPLLKRIRAHLVESGATFRFSSRVEAILPAEGRGRLLLADGTSFIADRVILAPGGSSRDLMVRLRSAGVAMQPKPFAVGFRVEHPQALINEIQYGRWAHILPVPPAEYRLTYHRRTGGRSGTRPDDQDIHVYTFCMCPGGRVVPVATSSDQVCLNGMSGSARAGRHANSAVVTVVMPNELDREGDPVLAGLHFQERAERLASELGGGRFQAPAARLTDYLLDRPSREVGLTTYRCGVCAADLGRCYPASIHERLRAGIRDFDRRMRGFVTAEAICLGVETRTSSPVRFLRDEACRSLSHPFLYPGGEGAGTAGGIVSSAVDGIRIARAILGGA